MPIVVSNQVYTATVRSDDVDGWGGVRSGRLGGGIFLNLEGVVGLVGDGFRNFCGWKSLLLRGLGMGLRGLMREKLIHRLAWLVCQQVVI